MSTDKILHRIQTQINELSPLLELFVDETVQPSVRDCENLQKLLHGIQENIAVYKYNKQNKELSPSFNIHAKLSEVEAEQEKKAEISTEIKESVKLEKEEKNAAEHVTPDAFKKTEGKAKAPLSIGINDKFRFMNELFEQNSSEYNIAIEQLSGLNSWHEAEIYLNSLRNVYEWDPKAEVVVYFYSLIRKRFE
jgi:hypothetical protein